MMNKKELSIEEKARAYDEAIARAKEIIECSPNPDARDVKMVLSFFPELVESDDERMRNAAINACKYMVDNFENSTKQYEDAIAWLEKQGEQKSVDKVEQKFKVGDKIKLAEEPKYPAREIIAIKNDAYYFDRLVHLPFSNQDEWELVEPKPEERLSIGFERTDGYVDNPPIIPKKDFELADKLHPKFKVGDWIISHYNHVAYIKYIDEKNYFLSCSDGNSERLSIDCINRNWRLWTIQDAKDGDVLCSEQMILLFKKWEDNYWNFVIAYAGIDISGKLQITDGHWLISNSTHPATKEQRDQLEKAMTDAGYTFDFEKKELKKIEQKPAWSKEDENRINRLIAYFEDEESFTAEDDIVYANWLKSLKDRVWPKQEWSEEDREMRMKVLKYLSTRCNVFEYEEVECWLKSLEDRYTWKPSDEQLRELGIVATGKGWFSKEILSKLLEQLKKLKGEE